MDIFKIAVGKFVSLFCILGMCVVDPEMPFCIFTESVQTNEFVLFLGRRLVLTPCTLAVRNNVPLLNKLSGVVECIMVEPDCVILFSRRQLPGYRGLLSKIYGERADR